MTSAPPGTVRLIPLGGLGEVGMNCLALEQGGSIVLVDCGVTFPTTDVGVDVFHPRFDYVLEHRDRLAAVVLTHGHEDHIGALPYLLHDVNVPVLGPAHALELVRERLAEHEIDAGRVSLTPVAPGRPFAAGPFEIEPIRVTHSITQATALAIRTAAGIVVHTGDFKLDPTPPDGETTDEARLVALGAEGVRLLLSDSTSIDSPGSAGSERDVGRALEEIVLRARTRVVLGIFASNVQRLRMIGDAAARAGRNVSLLGRSVMTHVRAAQACGRLSWPSDLVVPPEVAATMPRERVLVVASGTQAERMSALARLANGTHPLLKIEAGDVVVLSSRIIPGNDRPVFDMMAGLLRLGVELTTALTDRRVHASGHAHRDEQRRMIDWTSPRSFMPVHGTLHHLVRHASLARDAGVEDVLVAEDGDIVELAVNERLKKNGRVLVGRVATYGGEQVSAEVLKDRAQLGRAGIAFVALVVDAHGNIAASPSVVARGVTDPVDSEVLRGAARAVERAVSEADARTRRLDDELADVARLAARRAIESAIGRRPLVSVALTRLRSIP